MSPRSIDFYHDRGVLRVIPPIGASAERVEEACALIEGMLQKGAIPNRQTPGLEEFYFEDPNAPQKQEALQF